MKEKLCKAEMADSEHSIFSDLYNLPKNGEK